MFDNLDRAETLCFSQLFIKSLHKLSAVIDIGIHQAEAGIKHGKTYQLKYQKDIVKIPNKLAYVAHIKKNMLPPQNLGC